MNGNRIALSAALLATTGLVPLSSALAQETTTDDVITVRYQYVPDDKRVTSEVSSFLSVEDIAVTGDADIAAALGRVTGLSVQDGRFVIVRGLNERYSNTLINGSPLASPEPLRRAVPLDLFPTSLISNILVQKTFSPQFPGEFGGGLVEIETTTLPNEGFFEIGLSLAADTATSFDEGLVYDGGSNDWTGFGDDTRDWPEQFKDIFNTENISPAIQDPVTLAEIGRNLENSKLWVIQEGDIPGDIGVDFSGGQRFDFDGFSLGLLASVGYDNSWETRVGERGKARIASGTLSPRTQFDRFQTTNTIESNGMLGAGFETDAHEVRALAFVLRSTEKEAQILAGRDDDRNADIRIDSTAWFERQVYTYQLSGEHAFDLTDAGALEIEWRASTSDASREAPNGREAVYEDEDTGPGIDWRLLNSIDGNSITFSRVDDVTDDLGFDLLLPVSLFGLDWEWKAGYATMDKERTAFTREFGFEGSIPAALSDSRIDYIFADQNILDTRFRLREVGGILTPEAYRGDLNVDAWYVGTDVQLTPFLRAALGARMEDGEQIVDTFGFPANPGPNPIETQISEDYVLPAATLTWTFADNLQLRLGYSETLTRPQFRELGFAEFFNTETDERFRGNPYLVNTEITNYDARLEYYFGRNQFITAGVFHKELDAPIVEYILPEGETLATSFINAPEATLTGFEIEYEQAFALADLFDGDGFWRDAEIFVKANYTYTESEMSGEGTVIVATPQAGQPQATTENASGYISDGQTLQGQSEHLANLQIGWEEDTHRTALLFNYTGERTRALANVARGLPEVVEEPPFLVDLVHSRSFELEGGDYLDVRFAVRNLLGEDYVATQSAGGTEFVVDAYEIGTTFSLSLTRSF
ncbi:MAG: TonB-dependent receptor domain-containing protein [Oceanicaulis sp.]